MVNSSQRQLYFFTRQDLLHRLDALEKDKALNIQSFFGKENADGEKYKYQFSIGRLYKDKYLIRSEIGVYRIGEEAYKLAKEEKMILLPDYIGHEGNKVM
jgi:hypothetical protein